jgi:protein-tyrosine-phosphatase
MPGGERRPQGRCHPFSGPALADCDVTVLRVLPYPELKARLHLLMEPDSGRIGPSTRAVRTAWDQVRLILGRAARAMLGRVERVLHPLRRTLARRRLARPRPPDVILVLCYGNICRSPYAASFLARVLRDRGVETEVSQGGFFGPDRPAHATAITVARDRGIDLESHRSRMVTAAEARRAGLVIVMEWGQARRVETEFGVRTDRILILGDLDPDPVATRRIPDPYGHAPEVFRETYDRIDRCVRALVGAISAGPVEPPRSPE